MYILLKLKAADRKPQGLLYLTTISWWRDQFSLKSRNGVHAPSRQSLAEGYRITEIGGAHMSFGSVLIYIMLFCIFFKGV